MCKSIHYMRYYVQVNFYLSLKMEMEYALCVQMVHGKTPCRKKLPLQIMPPYIKHTLWKNALSILKELKNP